MCGAGPRRASGRAHETGLVGGTRRHGLHGSRSDPGRCNHYWSAGTHHRDDARVGVDASPPTVISAAVTATRRPRLFGRAPVRRHVSRGSITSLFRSKRRPGASRVPRVADHPPVVVLGWVATRDSRAACSWQAVGFLDREVLDPSPHHPPLPGADRAGGPYDEVFGFSRGSASATSCTSPAPARCNRTAPATPTRPFRRTAAGTSP